MEENKNVEPSQNTIVQEKPKKDSKAALILGIIGTSTGVVALLLIIGGFFFQGARAHMMNNVINDRDGRIEVRGSNAYNGDFCRGFRR